MTTTTRQRVQRIADAVGGEVYEGYSGRCMFGAKCWGITCKGGDVHDVIARGKRAKLGAASTDNMGLDMIVYWQGAAWAPEPEVEVVAPEAKAERLARIKLVHNARERLRRAKLARTTFSDAAAQVARIADAQAALDALLHPAIAAAVAAAPAEPVSDVAAVNVVSWGAALPRPGYVPPAGTGDTERDDAPVLGPDLTVAALAAACGEGVAATIMDECVVRAPVQQLSPLTDEHLCAVHAARQRLQLDERVLGLNHSDTVAARAKLADLLSDAMLAVFSPADRDVIRAAATFPPSPPCVIDEANDVEPPKRGAWGKLTASPARLAAPDAPPPVKPKRARKAPTGALRVSTTGEYGRIGTAAELYRRSIMEGYSDEGCYERVKQLLGDKAAGKATYAGWYRAQLRKNGKNPPVSTPATTSAKTN